MQRALAKSRRTHASAPANGGTGDPALEAYKLARLDELARMRNVGIDCAKRIGLAFAGELSHADTEALGGMARLLPRFFRTERAVRQIVVLEMELLGLRAMPDRGRLKLVDDCGDLDADRPEPGEKPPDRESDWTGRNGYDTGPYDEVVARVRRDFRGRGAGERPLRAVARAETNSREAGGGEASLGKAGHGET